MQEGGRSLKSGGEENLYEVSTLRCCCCNFVSFTDEATVSRS